MTARRALPTVSIAAAVLALVSLGGCSTAPTSGDEIAAARANDLAEQLGWDMNGLRELREGAHLAAAAATQEARTSSFTPASAESITIEPLDWTGVTNVKPGAEIEVRYRVEIDAYSANQVFGRRYDAGSATRCYHYVVYFNTMDMREIECPTGPAPAPAPPTPSPLPALPSDARERLEAALTASDTATLDTDVREAFPDDSIVIETDAVDGRLIAALVIPGQRDCLVGTREVDGTVSFGGFDPAWLEPGEIGCSTRLVTAPPS